MKRWLYLTHGDLRRLSSDWVLLMSVAAPLLLLLFVWYALPWVEWATQIIFHLSIRPYLDFIMSFLALVSPMTIGMLAGFLMLDDREEGLLLMLSITPLNKQGYLAYRLSLPVLFSFFFTGIFLLLADLLPINPISMLPALFMLSLEAPLVAFLLVAWAENKVEGLAISKLLGLSFIGPVAAYFLPLKWRWTLWWLPTYWASASFLSGLSAGESYWITNGIGFLVHGVWIWAAYRKFMRRGE